MSQYHRNHPDEPISHDWTGGKLVKRGTFMGKCIKCGTNFIGTAASPPPDGLCKYCEIDQLKAEVADLRSKNLAWATGVEQSNTDIVDMQRDEFKRIVALTDNSEIKGICERAIACIEQTVPVIVQRDRLQRELDDNERWMRDVLTDYRIPFDDHKVGRRLAFTQWMFDKSHDL